MNLIDDQQFDVRTFAEIQTVEGSSNSVVNYLFGGWVNLGKFVSNPFKTLSEWDDKASSVHSSSEGLLRAKLGISCISQKI